MNRIFRSPNGELVNGNGTVVRQSPRHDAQTEFEEGGAEAAWDVKESNSTATNDFCDVCDAVTPTQGDFCSACGNPVI